MERLLSISDRLIGPGEEGGMNVVHVDVHIHVHVDGSMEDADVVDIGDADGALTVTAYVVVLLVGFVRVVVVDFFEFSIFVVVGLVDPS